MLGSMASRKLGSSLVGRAAGARCSPPASHANAATGARAVVSLTQMYHAAFTSAVNNGDAAPTTWSEEDRKKWAAPLGEKDPVDRAAEKAEEVGRKVKGAVEEVKDAGRIAKDQAKEVGDDVKESIKQTRP